MRRLLWLAFCVVLGAAAFARDILETRAAYPAGGGDSFSFVVFGDSHDDPVVFPRLIARLKREKDLSFGVHLGDLTVNGARSGYERYLEQRRQLGFPVHQVPGNHDLAGDGRRYFRRHFGPDHYSFSRGRAHFIVLNNAFAGSFDAAQFAWLKKELERNDRPLVFVFLHRPTFDPAAIYDSYVMSGREVTGRLMGLFEKGGVDYVFAGHIHGHGRAVRNGVVYVVTGGAGGRLHLPRDFGGRHHYVRISVKGDKVTERVVYLDEQEETE